MTEKHKTVEERLAYLEAKAERLEVVEKKLKYTQQALQNLITVHNSNLEIIKHRISNKSDGFFSDLFNW